MSSVNLFLIPCGMAQTQASPTVTFVTLVTPLAIVTSSSHANAVLQVRCLMATALAVVVFLLMPKDDLQSPPRFNNQDYKMQLNQLQDVEAGADTAKCTPSSQSQMSSHIPEAQI